MKKKTRLLWTKVFFVGWMVLRFSPSEKIACHTSLSPDSSFFRVILCKRNIEGSSRIGVKREQKSHSDFIINYGEAKGSSDCLTMTQSFLAAH